MQEYLYQHGDLTLRGRLALPEGAGLHPAVMLMHDALGIGELVCNRATELAACGYVALVTDMYGTGLGQDRDVHAEHFMALQGEPAKLRDRVIATFEALRAVPNVDPGRIGGIGFCFGGQCVLELARSGADIAAVVSLHGLLKTAAPAAAGEISAKMLVLTGAQDPHIPMEDVRGFEDEMIAAGADWQVTIYGKGAHSFTDPQVGVRPDVPGARYDPLLARLSWAQSMEFLQANMVERSSDD